MAFVAWIPALTNRGTGLEIYFFYVDFTVCGDLATIY